jgi:hypothetical protein
MNDIGDTLYNAADEFFTTIGEFLPNILVAILLLVVGLLFAKLAEALVRKLVGAIKVDKITKNKTVKKSMGSTQVKFNPAPIAGRVAFWVVLVIFLLTIAEVLGLEAMRDTIRNILNYLPRVFAAIVVLTIAVAGARIVREVVAAALSKIGVDYARVLAGVAYFILVVFGAVLALDQLGFDTTIITNNVTVLVAGVSLAFALAFGLGGRDVAGQIVQNVYDNSTKLHGKRKNRR